MIPIPNDRYAVQEIGSALLLSVLRKVGGADASSLGRRTREHVPLEDRDVQALTAWMLDRGSAERFSLGNHELIAARFAVSDHDHAAVTIVAVEDYHAPFPALVDGHMVTRDQAITAWLGDCDAEDHPDLYLVLGAHDGAFPPAIDAA